MSGPDPCSKPNPIAWCYKGPGPAAYEIPPLIGYKNHDVTKYTSPAYTMREKLPGYIKDEGPGPSDYTIQYGQKARDHLGIPAFSLRLKQKESDKALLPGPGKYDLPNANVYRYKWPAFSLLGKAKDRSAFGTPGPAAYSLPSLIGPKIICKLAGPAFTIKGRAPEFFHGRDHPEVPYFERKRPGPAFTMRGRLKDVQKTFPCGPGSHNLNNANAKSTMKIIENLGIDFGNSEMNEKMDRHLTAFLWGTAMTVFGWLIIKADMRPKRSGSREEDLEVEPYPRDIICGLEQRYFVVLMNGMCLYVSLVLLLAPTET